MEKILKRVANQICWTALWQIMKLRKKACIIATAWVMLLTMPSARPQESISDNPFGIMLPSQTAASPRGMQVARELGVAFVRPGGILISKGRNAACDAALQAGFDLVLTVRNSDSAGLPSKVVTDLATYQADLGKILDIYHPEMLVVENEENAARFYSGTPEDYATQLRAACEVAHQKGIPCTNGGLASTLVALIVCDDYLQKGETDKAHSFAARTFGLEQQPRSASAQEQIRKGKSLLRIYKDTGIDYVNFHWYFADTAALREAVVFLKNQTGLPALTNEIGQRIDNPNQTTAVMREIVELGLPIAVWYGRDGSRARGLMESDGTLRPTGEAFKRFIQDLSSSQSNQ
jgi:hypothetical protein